MIELTIESLSKGDFKVGSVKLNMEKGILYHLTGKNGSGKSILLNYLLKYYLKNYSNKVIYCPDDYVGYKNLKIKEIEQIYKLSSLSWDFNEYNFLFENLLSMNKNKYIAKLSTGEKTKLLLCILLAYKPELIIFDEALYSLDEQSKEFLLSYIKSYIKKNDAYFIGVSHESELSRYTDKVIDISEVIIND